MHRVTQCIVVFVVLGFGVGTLGSATERRQRPSPDQPLEPSLSPNLSARVSLPKLPGAKTSDARVAPPVELLRGDPTQAVASPSSARNTEGVPCSAVGCYSSSTNENEDCVEFAVDTLNGGCVAGGWLKATQLIPFQIMCGQSWAVSDGSGRHTDVDWYLATGIQEDSLTWYITAEFDFDYELWHYPCNGGVKMLSGSGSACDTVRFAYRTSNSWPVNVKIVPSASAPASMPCNLGPWNYHIWFIPNCEIACPPGSVNEGEGCSADPSIDNFNGGCFSSPEVYSTIMPGQPVCGLMSSQGFSRDTDWYRTASALAVGDIVSWRVSAAFPHAIYIIDQRRGCFTRQVASALGEPCATSVAEWRVDTAGIYTFVLGALQSDYGYPCAEGPWEYTATLELCAPECTPGGTPEGEVCDEYGGDGYNGGCDGYAFALQPIALGERICGEAWRKSECTVNGCHLERDTDWYVYNGTAGEELTWTVRSEFAVDIGVAHVQNGCEYAYFSPFTWSFALCAPLSVTYQVPVTGQVIFYVAPAIPQPLPGPQLTCTDGPWKYEAIVESAPCECQCHADPQCDGVVSIFDVTRAINVAFRGDPAIPDPSATCPYQTTDVNCDGVTSIFDVTRIINVAFRGGDAATEFCDPCL